MRIINGTDAAKIAAAAGFPGVFIDKAHASGPYGAGWAVVRPGYKTDPRNFHNGGKAHFRQIAEAKDWAGSRYGVEKWVRIKGIDGAYFPAQAQAVIEEAMAAE